MKLSLAFKQKWDPQVRKKKLKLAATEATLVTLPDLPDVEQRFRRTKKPKHATEHREYWTESSSVSPNRDQELDIGLNLSSNLEFS